MLDLPRLRAACSRPPSGSRLRDRRLLLRRVRGGRANASRAANGACSVSLRSEDVVGVRWVRKADRYGSELAVLGAEGGPSRRPRLRPGPQGAMLGLGLAAGYAGQVVDAASARYDLRRDVGSRCSLTVAPRNSRPRDIPAHRNRTRLDGRAPEWPVHLCARHDPCRPAGGRTGHRPLAALCWFAVANTRCVKRDVASRPRTDRVIGAQYRLRIKVRTMEQVASDGGRMPITSAVCLIRLFVA
ncbi:hypothetical protein NG2371_00086 [Nocardia gamkensis]|nr:hypothetical protein [Nocardia gamkensis]